MGESGCTIAYQGDKKNWPNRSESLSMGDISTMDELTKALRNFLTRDVIYIIGGFSVLLSFLAFFGRANLRFLEQGGVMICLFLVGLSYVVGFGMQELFCLIGLLTTSFACEPRRCLFKWFYRRYTRQEWNEIPESDQDKVYTLIDEKASPKSHDELERIVCLLLLCTTMGSCSTVSGILLVVKGGLIGCCPMVWIGGVVFFFGLLFMLLSHIKAAEHRRYVYNLSVYLKEQKPTA